MLDLVITAFDNIDHNLHIGLVLVNLKKAFNTVYYKILSNKLAHYCIRGATFKLKSSYLNYRKQFLDFIQIQVDFKEIKYAVLQ